MSDRQFDLRRAEVSRSRSVVVVSLERRGEPPSSWRPGRTLQATAIAPDGKAVGAARGELRNGRFVLPYARELNDHPVAAYRITVSA